MSNRNHNYTNYSKPNKPAEVVAPEIPEENVQNLQETETTETTVNETETPEVLGETNANATPEPEVPEVVTGVVVNCEKLNIRAAANAKAEVLCIINKGKEVEIVEEESTDDFYAVTFDKDNGDLVEGYCMKQYIDIK